MEEGNELKTRKKSSNRKGGQDGDRQDSSRPNSKNRKADQHSVQEPSLTDEAHTSQKRSGGALASSGNHDSDDALVCKICKKIFTSEGDMLVECERCEKWECLACSEMSAAHYRLLNETDINEFIHWYCKECNGQAVKAVKTERSIEESCKEYMSKFRQEISTEIQAVKTSLDTKIGKEVTNINKNIADLKKEVNGAELKQVKDKLGRIEEQLEGERQSTLEELWERNERKLNLVVFNMPESNRDEAADRVSDDLEKLRAMLKTIEANVPITKTDRLGKRSELTRPLKISVKSMSDKQRILKNASKLSRIPDLSDIHINRDMTPLERDQWKILVKERKERVEESKAKGEVINWIIRNGKVIKGRPRGEEVEEERV